MEWVLSACEVQECELGDPGKEEPGDDLRVKRAEGKQEER